MRTRELRATLQHSVTGDERRFTFVECPPQDGQAAQVLVYDKEYNYGRYNLDRFGDKLAREWVRSFAYTAGHKVVKW